MKLYKINVYHTHIEITNYVPGDQPDLERMLSIWDDSKFKLVPRGLSYDEETLTLRICRGVSLHTLSTLFGEEPNMIYTPDDYDNISVRMIVPPKDDEQRQALAFLVGEGEYHYTKKYSQLLLNLSTGGGKTYVATAAISFFRMTTMCIVHTEKIQNQWLETFANMTDLDMKKHVCVIKGSASIERLLKKKNNKYKVYIVNHKTLTSYASKNGWISVHELFKALNIGLKIMDEAHLNFDNMMKIDMYTNCKKSVYLTATFARSDHNENRLFKIATSNIVRYGKETVQTTRKHVMYLSILFNSHPSVADEASMYTMRKFNTIRYMKYELESRRFFDALKYSMDFLVTVEGKILVLSSTIESCGILADYIKNTYLDKTISQYHSGLSAEEKEDAFNADIICSTIRSAGTGADIRGLRAVVNTEAYSSQVTADQVAGRLREYNEIDNTFYIELVDKGIKHAKKMYERRLPAFKKKCLKVSSLDFEKL
jgi:superfamily II DNA or RNA helicase